MAKADEHDPAKYFKLASPNNNQRSIKHLEKNEDCNKILNLLCEKLRELKLGELTLVKEFEEDFVTKKLGKY